MDALMDVVWYTPGVELDPVLVTVMTPDEREVVAAPLATKGATAPDDKSPLTRRLTPSVRVHVSFTADAAATH